MKTFESVADLKLAKLKIGERVSCKRYYDEGAFVEGLVYDILSGTGDGNFSHTLANSNYAKLIVSPATTTLIQGGATVDIDVSALILTLIALINKVVLPLNSFGIKISVPLNVPSGCVIDLGNNALNKTTEYIANATNTYFHHVGNGAKLANINAPNIGFSERLISYATDADNNTEIGCFTGRGSKSLIKFEGVVNNNYSETLNRASVGKRSNYNPSKIMTYQVTTAGATAAAEFRRIRPFPSFASITHLKVTDTNGSPDFRFEMRMSNPATFPFIRARDSSDINEAVSIDWFNTSFDDLTQCQILNHKGTATTFEIEITYRDGRNGLSNDVWQYMGTRDFNRPHDYGAATIIEAQRGIEYRSYIGTVIDIKTSTATRAKDANYNYPILTIPTPAGTRNTALTTELKFYFNFNASQALSTGATHILFRVFQQTRDIKCTVINGFLSQVPDWSTEADNLSASYQPDVEVNLSGATRDVPQEVLIPLDKKAMMNAVIEEKAGDLPYFYLTFFDNLAGHIPIEWGDSWEFDCLFVKA